MRKALFLPILALAALAGAQEYRPKPGETVIRLEVAGKGNVFIRLDLRRAPKTAGRILELVKSGFYDGQRFHRVDRNPKPYIAVVGDPASKDRLEAAGSGGSGTKLAYEESGLSNDVGAVGLAHPEDDPKGDSQFYIVMGPAQFLDGGYTVFGKVVSGMEIVQRLARGDRLASVRVVSSG